MEPNLLSGNAKSKLNQDKTGSKTETQLCSEITVREFLEFLKTAYQVQDSVEGVLQANGMTEAIDWLKLKESQFIKRDESSCQTTNSLSSIKASPLTDNVSKKSSTSLKISDNLDSKTLRSHSDFLGKSSEVLIAKLNEVLSEGLLDPILPLLPASSSPVQAATRKSSLSRNSDKSLASVASSNTSVDKNSKKKSSEEASKVPVDKTSSQVEIHVCDEVKNMKKDFYCNQKLLVEKMGYFAEVTAGQRLEDMDISVHCDVGIFEWLMKWVQKESLLEEDWPQLDAQNVIPIVVSAAFLQMEPLLEECLRYCHENMNEILRTSTNLSCLNDQILNRLAAMYTNTELDSIRDKKDKLQSKLFTKLIVSLAEPEPECVRGHWSSLSRTYKCGKCHQLIDPSVSLRIPCVPTCMRLQYEGSISSYHVRDPQWNINEHIEKLYKQLKSWRRVYWRLWGHAHFLYCLTCKRFFPANQLGWCLFHPDAPQFFTLDAQKAPLPVGRYPCCGDRAYRFQLLSNYRGCKFRDHSVCTKSVKDSAVFNLLLSYRHLVAEEPPELMFPERLTRLVARDASTSDKLVCKELFWWDGLQIVPPRPRMGLLNMFSERGKGQDGDCRGHSTDDESPEESSNSNRSSSSGSSEESRPRSPRPVKKKRKKRKECRLWQVHLSARSNQDAQRSYEESTLKQMATLLNKRSLANLETANSSKNKCGRFFHKNTNPLGGIWVRLESEWKEQNVNNQRARPLLSTKGRYMRNGSTPDNKYINQRAIEDEASRFGDLVQGNFQEAYRNLTYKHLMGLKWVNRYCEKAQYVVKMDDDIVVNLMKLLKLLEKFDYNEEFISGYILKGLEVKRIKANKWFVSQEEYAQDTYPPFASGWLYITTPTVTKKLEQLADQEQYFWIDDVFITGILSQKINLKMYDIKEVYTDHPEYFQCCLNDYMKERLDCDVIVGPNGGRTNLFHEFNSVFSMCDMRKCSDRLYKVNESCIKSGRIENLGRGNAVISSYKLVR